jgi:hypothetical protein
VTSQGQLQLATSEVPDLRVHVNAKHPGFRHEAYLDHTVPSTSHEPLVTRLDRNAAHPTEMTADNAHKFPWRVVIGLNLARGLASRQRGGEC